MKYFVNGRTFCVSFFTSPAKSLYNALGLHPFQNVDIFVVDLQ